MSSGELGSVTIRDALQDIPGVAMVAGAAGLDRSVRSVGILEAPDSVVFVKPGDLVMTALYAIRGDPRAQVRLITQLEKREAAGLAVKRSFVPDLPEGMLAEADRLRLPLLSLPNEAAFSDVMQPIFVRIVNHQAAVLRKQQHIYRVMIKALLDQRGISTLAQNLAGLLGNPVVICDPEWQVEAWAPGSGVPGFNDFQDIEAMARSPVGNSVPVVSDAGAVHYREAITMAGRHHNRVVSPVMVGGRLHARLMVWEVDRPVCNLDLMALDTAATVIALEFSNRRSLVEVERRYRNEFMATLLSSETESPSALAQRARLFGLDLDRSHYVLVIAASHEDTSSEELRETSDTLYRSIPRAAAANGLVGELDMRLVLICAADADKEAGAVASRASEARPMDQARAVLRRLDDGGGIRATVGVGNAATGVEGVRKSFREARQAVTIAQRVWGPGRAVHFNDLGVFQILDEAAGADGMGRFLSNVRSLADYDQARGTGLVATLETFFSCNGSIRQVADSMFLHYNTVLYRLNRIQQITGMDLKNADDRLHLQVALKAARLTDVPGGPLPGRSS